MPEPAPVTIATRPSNLYDDTTTVRVTIVGAGLMGAQIGCEYALGGHDVVLHARDPHAARARAESAFALVDEHGLATPSEVEAASGRVATSGDAAEAAEAADLIVESLPEELELKAAVVGRALTAASDAIVATNTSSLSISVLGEAIGHAERTVGTHYLNPPLLMPTVEVIAGAQTSPATVALARDTLASLGKLPVVVQRDVPGFVWNRLQFALVRECVWLVENGVAAKEDVDTVLREGLARRWRRVGPLRAIALGGIETWNRSGANIVRELSAATELPDLAGIALTGGDLAQDAARRDAALARELRDERSV
jgi:3-hydroxyacyl-CoA dehydrogenase